MSCPDVSGMFWFGFASGVFLCAVIYGINQVMGTYEELRRLKAMMMDKP